MKMLTMLEVQKFIGSLENVVNDMKGEGTLDNLENEVKLSGCFFKLFCLMFCLMIEEEG